MKKHQRSTHAMSQELVMGMQKIIAMHDLKDEVVWHIAELFADLFATYVSRGPKRRVPRRKGPHPAMVELLARLDRYASEGAEPEAATFAAAA